MNGGSGTPTNDALRTRREAAVARGVASSLSAFVARAENAEIWDVEGKQYIDFAAGIAVLNVGHRHPKVQAAVAAQLARYTHPAFQVMAYEPYITLAERLNRLAPGAFAKKAVFFSTGAEAVENAIKIARAHTRRSGVVAFAGGFHGRTLMGLALTGKATPYKLGFGPLPGPVFHAPYPVAYHDVTVADALHGLEQLFKVEVAPEDVAAMIVEPVLGEGGYYPAPPEFLAGLRAICDLHGIVLVADEIQSGFARTGRMFASEHAGVAPDLMVVAKSLGGGLPIAGVIGKADIMDAPGPGGLGGTYGGNPVACAAALAVLDIIVEENLIARAETMGVCIRERLAAMATQPSLACIGNVHGLGAMCGIELVRSRETREPDAALAKAVVERAAAHGLIVLGCGLYGNVVRLIPPLTIEDALLGEGLDRLEAALRDAVDRRGCGG